MKTLLGWRNSSDSDVFQITDADLLSTDSGLYYNDVHPLLRIGVIENIILETDNVETYLQNKINQGINKMLRKMTNFKKEMASTKTLLNSAALFDGVAPLNNTITAESRFVGMEFELKPSYGVDVTIDKIGFQSNSIQAGFNLYLFHSSQEAPIQTIPVTTAVARSFQWITLATPISLKYLSDTYDVGGLFYLGYFEDDITGQALKKDFNFSRGVCGTCNRNAYKIWNTRLDFLRITPMYVANGNLNGGNLFDYNDVVHTSDNNYGLNLKTTVKCDLSSYFCEQKLLFADALGYQVAIDILEDIKHSDRANRIAEVNRNMIIRDLEGDRETNEKGLAMRAEDALKALDFDFSSIDSPCIPCNKPSGVRVRAI
jgi:hypothetical protein